MLSACNYTVGKPSTEAFFLRAIRFDALRTVLKLLLSCLPSFPIKDKKAKNYSPAKLDAILTSVQFMSVKELRRRSVFGSSQNFCSNFSYILTGSQLLFMSWKGNKPYFPLGVLQLGVSDIQCCNKPDNYSDLKPIEKNSYR
jgi:hypothetical protein